jgi:hypothetical protein
VGLEDILFEVSQKWCIAVGEAEEVVGGELGGDCGGRWRAGDDGIQAMTGVLECRHDCK